MNGVVHLREKPDQRLVNTTGYRLDDDAGLDDFLRFAQWVGQQGGLAPYVDEYGVLVVSQYGPDSESVTVWGRDRYYEFITASSFVVYDPEHQEFTVYGSSMTDKYEVLPPTGEDRT